MSQAHILLLFLAFVFFFFFELLIELGSSEGEGVRAVRNITELSQGANNGSAFTQTNWCTTSLRPFIAHQHRAHQFSFDYNESWVSFALAIFQIRPHHTHIVASRKQRGKNVMRIPSFATSGEPTKELLLAVLL